MQRMLKHLFCKKLIQWTEVCLTPHVFEPIQFKKPIWNQSWPPWKRQEDGSVDQPAGSAVLHRKLSEGATREDGCRLRPALRLLPGNSKLSRRHQSREFRTVCVYKLFVQKIRVFSKHLLKFTSLNIVNNFFCVYMLYCCVLTRKVLLKLCLLKMVFNFLF